MKNHALSATPRPFSRSQRATQPAERGSALIVTLIFLAVALVLITGASQVNVSAMRGAEQEESKARDKWQTRSAAAVMTASLKVRLPQRYEQDLEQSRRYAGSAPLTAFDAEDLAPDASQPVAIVDEATGELRPTGIAPEQATSLLGQINLWATHRARLAEADAAQRGFGPQMVKVFDIRQIFRQHFGASEPAYILSAIVDAHVGYERYRDNSSEIILGPNDANCGTSVRATLNPPLIVRGASATLTVVYVKATRLVVKDETGNVVADERVDERPTAQSQDFTLSPTTTTRYRVEASGSGACQAVTPYLTLTVNDPACPSIVVFSASAPEVDAGESVTLTWHVTNAAEVRLDGNIVSTSGSQSVVINTDTTFTLTATGVGGSCPQTAQVQVTVRPAGGGPPPCNPPSITSFTANPATVQPGQATTLSWSITGAAATAMITLTGPDGFSQTVTANGSLVVTPPNTSGDYVYRLKAVNPCGSQAERPVVVRVTSCPAPQLTGFTASPSTVVQGAGGTVRLSWNVTDTSGLGVTVAIVPNVGGSLPASGTLDIPASLTTTTFTLTATNGCGNLVTAQVTVTLQPPVPGGEICRAQLRLQPAHTECVGPSGNRCDGVTIAGYLLEDELFLVERDGLLYLRGHVGFGFNPLDGPLNSVVASSFTGVIFLESNGASVRFFFLAHNSSPPGQGILLPQNGTFTYPDGTSQPIPLSPVEQNSTEYSIRLQAQETQLPDNFAAALTGTAFYRVRGASGLFAEQVETSYALEVAPCVP